MPLSVTLNIVALVIGVSLYLYGFSRKSKVLKSIALILIAYSSARFFVSMIVMLSWKNG